VKRQAETAAGTIQQVSVVLATWPVLLHLKMEKSISKMLMKKNKSAYSYKASSPSIVDYCQSFSQKKFL